MKAIVQRVLDASVDADGRPAGKTEKGFLVLLGVTREDTEAQADFLAKKIANLRVFEDAEGKMNLALGDIGGAVLAISNFTLCSDCKKGNRPSFVGAAGPALAEPLYERFKASLAANGVGKVESGVFGAEMQIRMTADGPCTIILDTEEIMPKSR